MREVAPQGAGEVPRALAPLVEALAHAAATLARRIARGPLAGDAPAAGGVNADGDRQVALDVVADDLFRAALARAGVRWYASEEQDEVLELDPAGTLAVALDPLDGSPNVDTNLSVGTIFSAYPAAASGADSFRRPLREQVLAGYVIYGPRVVLVLTWGEGLRTLLLDPEAGRFVPVPPPAPIPPAAPEFAINASNYRHWPRPVRAFVDDRVAGAEGPRERDFNMRWLASLVAEAHRILARGGVFLYPEDQRPATGAAGCGCSTNARRWPG